MKQDDAGWKEGEEMTRETDVQYATTAIEGREAGGREVQQGWSRRSQARTKSALDHSLRKAFSC